MKKHVLIALASLIVGVSCSIRTDRGGNIVNQGSATSHISGRPDMSWFTDARFGMFIHFGLYSIPAGEWNGQKMGRNWYAEWIRMQHGYPELNAEGTYGIPRDEYDTLLGQFNPVRFNADEWIRMAKMAGMKYFLITAKHHDGFALWPTKHSDYNVVDATPFRRDILGELAAACKKHGLEFGLYYSHWQDWGHGGALPPWPIATSLQPSDEAFEHYWKTVAIPQTIELIRAYKPRFFWFDNWRSTDFLPAERLEELIRVIRREDPSILINSRIGVTWNHPEGDVLVDFKSMGDNKVPKTGEDIPWETSGTMQRSWGYHKLDPLWKSTRKQLTQLIDCVSRGGNYQLNVGPMGDGSFPAPAVDCLVEIGDWMKTNGEAIYAAGSIDLPEPEWGRLTGKQANDDQYRIYAHVYQWPENERSFETILVLDGLSVLPERAFVLGRDYNLEVKKRKGGIEVAMPPSEKSEADLPVIVLVYPKNPLK